MLTTLSIISLDRGKPWREPPAAVEAGADAAPTLARHGTPSCCCGASSRRRAPGRRSRRARGGARDGSASCR
jgi:hypothetical protein